MDLQDELEALAKEIASFWSRSERNEKRAHEQRLAAALKLARARQICADTGRPWKRWVKNNVKRSYRDVARLVAIGQSENPEAAMLAANKRRQFLGDTVSPPRPRALPVPHLSLPAPGHRAEIAPAVDPVTELYDRIVQLNDDDLFRHYVQATRLLAARGINEIPGEGGLVRPAKPPASIDPAESGIGNGSTGGAQPAARTNSEIAPPDLGERDVERRAPTTASPTPPRGPVSPPDPRALTSGTAAPHLSFNRRRLPESYTPEQQERDRTNPDLDIPAMFRRVAQGEPA